ncbi:hypothetical protein K1T71_009215 [Dendrolimus kikuchii]|uniref:Uncharacterized protein n=1 Tax=Dendrolimus kikuchii TaxID=765133 RepID=A0ACC1CUG4_9NEOP|nr:hypothetical protein K1T71_009215 [Dendrolimus kikuchii]
MNISGNSDEGSCKGREDGDASTESERPLKKARFAWQVKGKYHLKNDSSETKATTSNSSSMETQCSSPTSRNNDIGTEQNLEILGDYLLKQDFNTLDSVITETETPLLKPSTSISNEKITYPRYVSSAENNAYSNFTKSSDNNNDVQGLPMASVMSPSVTEDHCIARWQARQMAKGFVDNTINRVLDSWIHVPLPAEGNNSRFLALDVAEFINNMPGDNSIENEGILMAISAHGLQNHSSSSSEKSESDSSDCGNTSPTRILTPLPLEDEHEPKVSKPANIRQLDMETPVSTTNDFELPWSLSDDEKNDPVSPLSESPVETYQCFSENQNSGIEQDKNENVDVNYYDILDAAILIAIHNKGLTAFGTEYG